MKISGAGNTHLCRVIDTALDVANEGAVGLADRWLNMPGMSGRNYRSFINCLIRYIPDPRYLEIGCYTGSTLCAALWRNEVTATAIDHWQEYGGKEEFMFNLAEVGGYHKVTVIDSDYREVDYHNIGKHNVYLFDGPHNRADQSDALTLVYPALDDEFVLIVDDWNWLQVRQGTLEGLEAIGANLLRWIEIRTVSNPGVDGAKSEWHNGYLIACVSVGGERHRIPDRAGRIDAPAG